MIIARKLVALVVLLSGGFLLTPSDIVAKEAPPPAPLSAGDREYRNTLLALGDRQLQAGQMNEALETFTQLLERFPPPAPRLVEY